jgi:3-oxoacyl-[acyl-carrier protein] reductase
MTSHFEPTDSLVGRVAVITGGTGAIGLASAQRLAQLGARCVLLYNSESPASATAKAAALPGTGHLTFKAQLTDSTSLQAVADQVASQCGQVHILVNSAGFTKAVPAADLEG